MRKIFIRLFIGLMVSYLTINLCSCSDSDSNEDSKGSVSLNEESHFYGAWKVSNTNGYIFLLKNGKAMYSNSNKKGKMFNWHYNTESRILATDIPYQWEISLVSDESWVGTYHAYDGSVRDAYAEKDYYQAFQFIYYFSNRIWLNKNGKECPFWDYNISKLEITESENGNSLKLGTVFIIKNAYDFDKVYIESVNDGEKYYPKNVSDIWN